AMTKKKKGILKRIVEKERNVNGMLQHTMCILARWRHYTRLKICVELQVCRPQGSAPLPPPRQYAGRYSD
ncbi:MAG: hypothetical protein FWC10_04030, partial [Lentimicrobiaceae bacterium]|nr:hypothetical protein [Lentimicrobiaceae bacterium]